MVPRWIQLVLLPIGLLALPIAAVIRQTVLYLRRHLVLEPWSTVAPRASMLGLGAACGVCGAPHEH